MRNMGVTKEPSFPGMRNIGLKKPSFPFISDVKENCVGKLPRTTYLTWAETIEIRIIKLSGKIITLFISLIPRNDINCLLRFLYTPLSIQA